MSHDTPDLASSLQAMFCCTHVYLEPGRDLYSGPPSMMALCSYQNRGHLDSRSVYVSLKPDPSVTRLAAIGIGAKPQGAVLILDGLRFDRGGSFAVHLTGSAVTCPKTETMVGCRVGWTDRELLESIPLNLSGPTLAED